MQSNTTAPAISETAQSSAPQNYALAFSDTFAGNTLDTTKWNYRTGVRLLSEQLPGNVVVGNNQLDINVGQQTDGAAPWTGGGIISSAKFRYGYYQVDELVTANPGWHTSFWVSGANAGTQGTEIDASEIDTQSPTAYSMGVHSWMGGEETDNNRCNSNFTQSGYNGATAAHTYGFEWTEDAVTYYLDGKVVCTQPYSAATYMHDAVSIQLSSVGYTPGVISTVYNPSPNTFANVSYFQRDYYINPLDSGYTSTGAWYQSSLTGFSSLPTQYSDTPSAAAQYTPNILVAGNYDVQVWKTRDTHSDPAAPLTVNYSGGSSTQVQDFTSGASGWVDLGTFPFASGRNGNVIIGYSGTGNARSSMVKLVRR